MYRDKPDPGKGYLAVLYVIMFGLVALLVFATPWSDFAHPAFYLIAGLYLLPIGIMVALVHAAYNTEYRIANGKLEAKAGLFFHDRIDLAEIEDMRRVKIIFRVLGWGFGEKGICNRFTNGLLLKTSSGKLYLSPSHVERFMDELEALRGIS